MDVTEIQMFLANEGRLKAYVTITFDKCFVVRDLKVIEGNKGLFVAMPSKKKKDGSYKDIAHPINSDFRANLERSIIEHFHLEMKNSQQQGYTPKKYDEDTEYSGQGEVVSNAPAYNNFREAEAGIGPVAKRD